MFFPPNTSITNTETNSPLQSFHKDNEIKKYSIYANVQKSEVSYAQKACIYLIKIIVEQ